MINPLIAAGLTLEQVVETQPTDEFRQKDPRRYELVRREPTFMCMRARLIAPR